MPCAPLTSRPPYLGWDEPGVRSSISRLKRRGILHASRRDGAAGYALSDEALAILREGDRRIFRRERAALGDGWLLAVVSVAGGERHQRPVVRAPPGPAGVRNAPPSGWGGPGPPAR